MSPETTDLLLTLIASFALIAAAAGSIRLLPWREEEMAAAERALRGVAAVVTPRPARPAGAPVPAR